MQFVRENPIIRMIIPFIVGIILSSFVHIDLRVIVFALILLFIFFIIFHFVPRRSEINFKWRFLPGIILSFFLFFSACAINQLVKPEKKKNFFPEVYVDKDILLLKVTELWSERARSYRTVAEVYALSRDSSFIKTSGKILLYVSKSNTVNLPEPGELMMAKGNFQTIPKPTNPHNFDFQKFMESQGILYQMFLHENRYAIPSIQPLRKSIIHQVLSLRKYLLNELGKIFNNTNDLAVASALLLGYRDNIDPELREAYAASGAMHILAVSGLHVGIIFIVFKYFTVFLTRFKYGNLFRALIIISLIWLFAILTGLAPSVRRASTMFTMITIATLVSGKSSIYNTIAGSALFLMIIDPALLFSLGFQLSYSAVISIIAFQPKLYSFFQFNNIIFDKAWALTTVSIAAQLGTAPISLYYFNIFPNYFILTNLIVIPAATLILYSGILFFILHPLIWIGEAVGFVLNALVSALNTCVFLIRQFPYSVTENVLLLPWEPFLFIGMLFILYRLFTMSYKPALILLFATFMLFQTGRLISDKLAENNTFMRVYDSGAEFWLEVRQGKKSHLLAYTEPESCNAFDFNVFPAIVKSGVNEKVHQKVTAENQLFAFAGYNVLLFDSLFFNEFDLNSLPKIDLLIIGPVNRLPINQITEKHVPQQIIFSSSFSYHRSLSWQEICIENEWPCHFVNLSGAITFYPEKNKLTMFKN